ncbi:hypothetical protein TSUD_212340 [Trifolium subterraneum]|uniref:RRM domain-containing protein n=1 Tax=Trifolium subterraneum TaxID=3900 RepID=A0A2Z6MEE3_TRISU|nr:hypothetical protein TSUD_212340 [Trifolium subterraneum]
MFTAKPEILALCVLSSIPFQGMIFSNMVTADFIFSDYIQDRRPRGTGFLKFKTVEAANNAISTANAASGIGILVKGRPLKVLKALDKKSAHEKELEEKKMRFMTTAIFTWQSLERKKKTKLQSPNFHVSKIRLVIYNLPKSMTEKQLKKLCIDAVISRATKQKPVIRQVDKDFERWKERKGYSRKTVFPWIGVAFLEFSEHQHALVALRVLNNNPETFGPEHRPIVEFALDNVQTLKLRNAKLQYQQQAPHDDNRNENDKPDNTGVYTHGADRKQKSQEHDKPAKDSGLNSNNEQGNTDVLSSKESPKASARKLKNNQDGQNHGAKLLEGKNTAIDSNNRKLSGKKDDAVYGKRKMQNQEQAGEKVSRKRAKKNKDSIGKDTVDKLDMLIEQYKSKFSQKGSQRNDVFQWYNDDARVINVVAAVSSGDVALNAVQGTEYHVEGGTCSYR